MTDLIEPIAAESTAPPAQAEPTPAEQPAPAAPPAPSERSHAHVWILLGLMCLAAGLRLFWLDRPAIWNDEAATMGRVARDYQDLLDALQFDGFTPLHYTTMWWIGHGFPVSGDTRLAGKQIQLAPKPLRALPVLSGVLMVPAIYFLARQLANRRTALVAAAFAACSAYMMAYSRDAKMYMSFWTLLTVHMGCLLWWTRTRQRVAWLAWVASGIATMGWHPSGMLLLAIEPFFGLSSRTSWRQFAISAAVAALGGVLLHFADGRHVPGLSRLAGSLSAARIGLVVAFLMALPLLYLVAQRPGWKHLLLFLMGLLIVGSGPAGYYLGFNLWNARTGGIVPGAANEAEQGRTGQNWERASGLSWVREWQGKRSGPELYLHTGTAHLFSWEWPTENELLEQSSTRQPIIPPAVVVTLGTVFAVLIALLLAGMLPWKKDEPPLRPDDSQTPWWQTLLLLSIWIVGLSYGFFYCRSMKDFESPQGWFDWVAALWTGRWRWVALAMLLIAAAAVRWRPSRATLVGVVVTAALAALFVSLWSFPVQHTGEAITYSEQIRASALQWILSVGLVPLVPLAWYFSGRTLRERMAKLGMLAAVVAILVGLCFAAYVGFDHVRDARYKEFLAAHPRASQAEWAQEWEKMWQSIWMPRYVGVVWPAVAIAAAMLLMRLPTRALRWGAVALLLAVNLGNGLARVVCDTEPPMARMAADIWAAQRHDGATWIRQVSTMYAETTDLGLPQKRSLAEAIAQAHVKMDAKTRADVALRDQAIARAMQAAVGRPAESAEPQYVEQAAAFHRFASNAVGAERNFGYLAHPLDSTVRTFSNATDFVIPHPGFGSLMSLQGVYYLTLAADLQPKYTEIRNSQLMLSNFRLLNSVTPFAVKLEVDTAARSNQVVNRVIVWERFDWPPASMRQGRMGSGHPAAPPVPTPDLDPILKDLGPKWKRVDVQDYAIRQHWTWRDCGSCRRSEYVRTDNAPATQPAH